MHEGPVKQIIAPVQQQPAAPAEMIVGYKGPVAAVFRLPDFRITEVMDTASLGKVIPLHDRKSSWERVVYVSSD
jgi:hypothetical protein